MAYIQQRDPAVDMVTVVPSDTVDIPSVLFVGELLRPRAIYVGTGGSIKYTGIEGNTRTVVVGAGVIPIRMKRIWSSGTNAADISVFY